MAKTTNPQQIEPESPESFFDHQTGAFYRKVDWLAFWTTFVISFLVYFCTLAPTVTLEDSGELAVASDYLGVPHPPGYPIWTLVTWFFQWIFHWVTYYGQPNPAWSVGLSSGFFGALACALLALLVSRSGADMLRTIKSISDKVDYSTESFFCWISGVTGGVLLCLTPVLWSQSVIVEVYSLNAFFVGMITVLLYRWMSRPKDDYIFYLSALTLGLGLTNHMSLLFLGPAYMAAIWFRDRDLFWDCTAGLFILLGAYLLWQAQKMGPGPHAQDVLAAKNAKTTFGLISLIVPPIALFVIRKTLGTEWKRVVIFGSMMVVGLSFYAYMPIASDQNPPMNWAYPRTPDGFKHAISRGQYEKINPIANFKSNVRDNPAIIGKQMEAIIYGVGPESQGKGYTSVVSQFTLPISLLALIPFFFIGGLSRHARGWILTTFIGFISVTVLFIIFQNPKLDVQTLFIGRVQYIQAHYIYALWISYGIIFGIGYIDSLLQKNELLRTGVKFASIAVLALPLVLWHKDSSDEEFIKIIGTSKQNGHDFGWQFGNWQLRGANAINEEIGPDEPPLPNPNYPPEMGTNAIFYGGTDPGRFVPTYMIFSAKVREDVFLITQNALADNTYMSVMRDLYGDEIWIPAQTDSNTAFQQYVKDVQEGRIPAGADVSFKDGRVSVQGVQGVMMINGILAKMIFEKNKHKHPFYVEESYVIPWMYPYLEPHGLIMKINSEPLPSLTPEMVKNDTDFWNWYCRRLLDDPKFTSDVVARKTFSKLRSALAGIYTYRRMMDEAVHAFEQAIDLYPLSPEANFRLADVFMQMGRFDDAIALMEDFLKEDPGNDKVEGFLNQLKGTKDSDKRRQELESILSRGGDINIALELAELYRRMNRQPQFEALTGHIMSNTNLPPNIYLKVAEMFTAARRPDLLETALTRYLGREPANPRVWVDLAAAQLMINKQAEALGSLRQAIALGGEPVRDIARKDGRFDAIRNSPQFQQLVPPIQASMPLNLPAF